MALPLPSFARTIVANLLILGVALLSPPVQAASTTSTTLSSSSNPSIAGTAVTFTATVAGSAGGTGAGAVTFSDGATSIGTATLGASGSSRAISAGDDHTCALVSGGAVQCWGFNYAGQLGNGTMANSSTPVEVTGLSSGVVAIASGGTHTCAVTPGGGVSCWGSNDAGQLGNNTTARGTTPVEVTGLPSPVVAIAAGRYFTCALTTDAVVLCWGRNVEGELGNGSTANSSAPVQVSGLSGVTAITGGGYHACALTSGGGVECWGSNEFGQIGSSTATTSSTPIGVPTLSSGVAAIDAGGYHTCVVTSAGGVECWGWNSNGQLGDGSTTSSPTPVAVSNLSSGVAAVSAGVYYTCAMTSGGGVRCWGNNLDGELGNNSRTSSSTPVDVIGLASGAEEIAAGGFHVCARTPDGSAQCWGVIAYGQASTTSATPVAVSGFSDPARATATLTTSTLPVGDHSITARFEGDDAHRTSTSAVLVQSVTKASTTTSLAGNSSRVAFGEPLTLTATVTASIVPDGGSVVFADATGPIAIAVVSGGRAVTSPLYLAVGTHSIVATFRATDRLSTSSSSPLRVVTVDPRTGAQFRANSRTTGSQQLPAVATLKAGGFVVVWASKDQDGSSWGIYGQRYTAAGGKAGAEFRVNSTTSNAQSYPVIAATTDGGFVTAWLGSDAAGKSTGIRAQRWTATGAKAGAEFRVDTTAGTKQSAPSIAASPKGGFLVAWVSNTASGTTFDVRGQAFAATGKKLGSEVRANATTLPSPTSPATVAALDNGTWGLAWTRAAKVGANPIVVAQRLTAAGARLGGEIPVTSATFAQSDPVATRLVGEGFLVAWVSQGQDGSGKGIYGQRYSAVGAKLGSVFRINATVAADQCEPALATRGGGGFVAAWTSSGQDGSGKGVFGRTYASGAAAVDGEFRLDTTTAGNQSQPATAVLSSTGFVAVWTSPDAGSGLEGVYGQRFHLPTATKRADRTAGAARPRS